MTKVGKEDCIVNENKPKRGRPRKIRTESPTKDTDDTVLNTPVQHYAVCQMCGSRITPIALENMGKSNDAMDRVKDVGAITLKKKMGKSTEDMDKLIDKIKEYSGKPIFVGSSESRVVKSAVYDNINHPSHYTAGRKYEPIDVAEDWDLDKDAYLYNAFTYLARVGRKGDALEDLQKARFYLDRKIKRMTEKR